MRHCLFTAGSIDDADGRLLKPLDLKRKRGPPTIPKKGGLTSLNKLVPKVHFSGDHGARNDAVIGISFEELVPKVRRNDDFILRDNPVNGLPHNSVTDIMKWAGHFFPEGGSYNRILLKRLLQEAQVAATNELGIADAIQWARGFTFAKDVLESDIKCLKAAQLDFTAMISKRLKVLSSDRLNRDRVSTMREDNPERALLFDLADGMRVFLPKGFVPNGLEERSPLRDSYLAVAPAVNRMLSETIKARHAIVLPRSLAEAHVPRLHYCKAHWTPKKGKPSGRPLGDLSFVDGTPINTEETAQAATAYYGEILHPTIQDIGRMVAV